MKALHLNLKKKWYDLTISGTKKEEYRELTPYWFARLIFQHKRVFKFCTGYDWDEGMYVEDSVIQWICIEKRSFFEFKPFDKTIFSNGYAKNRPQFEIDRIGISVGLGKQEWGAEKGKIYFIIQHGEIIKSNNQG